MMRVSLILTGILLASGCAAPGLPVLEIASPGRALPFRILVADPERTQPPIEVVVGWPSTIK